MHGLGECVLVPGVRYVNSSDVIGYVLSPVSHGVPGHSSLLLLRLLLTGLLLGPFHRYSLLIMAPALVALVWAEYDRAEVQVRALWIGGHSAGSLALSGV